MSYMFCCVCPVPGADSPLGRGMLTNTVDTEKLGGMDYRKMGKGVPYVMKDTNMATVATLASLAEAKGVRAGTLALAWLHKHGEAMLQGAGLVPIPGTTKVAHLVDNLSAVRLAEALTDADMQAIEAAVPKASFSDPLGRYADSEKPGKTWYTDKNPLPK